MPAGRTTKLASRAFDAVEKYQFGLRGHPRFKSYNQLDSVEGKSNKSGILWRKTTANTYEVRWLGLTLQPILDLAASGKPVFGTCAGMIVLAKQITDGEEPVLPLLDVSVARKTEADLDAPMGAKARGCEHMADALRGRPLY